MKEKKILLYCLLMCIATGIATGIVLHAFYPPGNRQKDIAVIDAVKLFDGYTMKKELEDMAKARLMAESKQMDSVANILQVAKAMRNDNEAVQRLMYTYEFLKKKLSEDYTQSDKDINAQVWKRLNPLLDEFGKSKGLHLIIGANGMGTVLYTDAYYDITNEAITFINKRYVDGN